MLTATRRAGLAAMVVTIVGTAASASDPLDLARHTTSPTNHVWTSDQATDPLDRAPSVDWNHNYCIDRVLVRVRPSAASEAALSTDLLRDRLNNELPRENRQVFIRSCRLLHEQALSMVGESALASAFSGWYLVSVDPNADIPSICAALKQCPLVADAHPDHIGFLHSLTNDPGFPQQWALKNSGQLVEGVAGVSGVEIGISKAWSFSLGLPDAVIAVLDTGVSQSHPDLFNQVVPGTNVVRVGQTWDDGSASSHGTYCSGIIAAATNNGVGIAGVAPNCKVLPVKVFSGIWGSESSVAAGLSYITGLRSSGTVRVEVANMSLGFSTVGSAFIDAVNNAANSGIVLVASTGNAPGDLVGYPARLSNVIAVGSTDNRDAAAVFQTTGAEMDISAPGVSIWTTTDVGTNPNSYSFQSGTSMAAPFVSATAALMRCANPALSIAEVRQLLMDSAKDLGAAGIDPVFGAGRLNAGAAVQRALLSTGQCVSDWNGDSVYNDIDLFAYLDDWFHQNADVDGNGITDTVDLFSFLNAWFYGC